MGIFSGLKNLGLGDLENASLFEEEKAERQQAAEVPQLEEKDFILDKSFDCPVCGRKCSSRVAKTGKNKLLSQDLDLRPRYEGIDMNKYDVVLCEHCGYATITRFWAPMPSVQVNLIKENISNKIDVPAYLDEYYTYEEAMARYKVALVCAMVKKAKNSEKAYICLKSAWLLRGYREELEAKRQLTSQQKEEIDQQEMEYLQNALKGFMEAQKSERYPMCGMDENTMDYMMAAIAYEVGELDMAAQFASRLLTSTSVNSRVKDKARELKDMIVARKKELGN